MSEKFVDGEGVVSSTRNSIAKKKAEGRPPDMARLSKETDTPKGVAAEISQGRLSARIGADTNRRLRNAYAAVYTAHGTLSDFIDHLIDEGVRQLETEINNGQEFPEAPPAAIRSGRPPVRSIL